MDPTEWNRSVEVCNSVYDQWYILQLRTHYNLEQNTPVLIAAHLSSFQLQLLGDMSRVIYTSMYLQ